MSTNRVRTAGLIAVSLAVAGLLAGCIGSPDPGAPARYTARPTTSATSAPTTAPPTTAPSAPSASSAPTESSAPAAPSTPPVAATPPESGGDSDVTQGCSPNGVAIPAGASTADVGDVDGDLKPDTEFYTEVDSFRYGIHTASGATIFLRDDLAGPGKHSGWSARLDGPAIVATVIDDGRSASLHTFIDCEFRTTMGADGQPYRFLLNGFGDYGTGVACNNRNGGTFVEGSLAKKRGDGLYDIVWTHIDISVDGRTATNGTTDTRYAGLTESDPLVHQAMGSYCNDLPKVATSGR